MPTLQHGWVDGGLIVIMAIGVVGLIVTRIKRDSGIGSRAIQFVGVCLVIPSVVILALEDKVSKENVGTILGAVIGYVLAGIGESSDRTRRRRDKDPVEVAASTADDVVGSAD